MSWTTRTNTERACAADGVIRLKDRTKDASRFDSSDLVWVEGDTRLQVTQPQIT